MQQNWSFRGHNTGQTQPLFIKGSICHLESVKPKLMRKHTCKLLLLLIIIPVFMDFRCSKESFPIDYQHNFVEKVDLFPAQKTYHIGDTVWVQFVNSDNKFLDARTSQRVLADSLSIPLQLTLDALYNTAVNPAAGFCDFVTSSGVNTGRTLGHFGTGSVLEFGCGTSNSYSFKIGIAFKEKGIFMVNLSGKLDVKGCSNRVNRYPNSNLEYTFNLGDGNKDVYFSIPLQTRGGKKASDAVESMIDGKKAFVLRVE